MMATAEISGKNQTNTGAGFGLIAIPALITLLLGVGLIALNFYLFALPDERSGALVAVFPPGIDPQTMYNAVIGADGRLVNSTWLSNAWVVYSDQPGFTGRLKAAGAWATYAPEMVQPLTLGGCYLVTPGVSSVRPE